MIIIFLFILIDLLLLGLGGYGLYIDNLIMVFGAGVVGTSLVSITLYYLTKDI